MANHNATVTYVEPNDMFSGLTAVVDNGIHYDRAPDLEDYCISINIGVEVSSREDGLRLQDSENKVIILNYTDTGGKSQVKFMSGTKIAGAEVKDDSGNSVDYRVLSTKPMDMWVTDLVDYGTTEMIGIKSVNIDYNSSEVPQVKIQFTDVRGMSLFQPKELNYDKSFNGIRGLSKDNIAQTFFQCFFNIPLPKFTMQFKGFYGEPVTYQMACEKFETNFNASTGDFDIDTLFIGFRYSFLTDISFAALLAAPYSDYIGKTYWDSQVEANRFKIRGKNGQYMNMPRLYEIRENFETIFNGSNKDFQINSLDNEERYHKNEIEELNSLKEDIKNWYEKFYGILTTKFDSDMVYIFKNLDTYERIIILTNGKDFLNNRLENLYDQLTDDFKKMTSDLFSKIEEYNEKADSFSKIDNLFSNNFKDYTSKKIFKKIYVDVNTDKFVFDGFYPGCNLPVSQTIKTIFTEEKSTQNKLRKFYYDGIDQFIDGFVIELKYSGIDNRIKVLEKEGNMNDDERTKREKLRLFNQSMFEKLNWYPTIENFTKVVMAHLETLMAMMHNVITRASGRTMTSLGVSLDNLHDVQQNEHPEKQIIPPFPRITKLVNGDDNITKREDAWIGEFGKPGGEIPEVDMINGLFNALNEISIIEKTIQEVKNQNSNAETTINETYNVKYPTTPYDLYTTKNLYGDTSTISNDIYEFVGKVALRMFNVLGVNTFRYQYDNSWNTKAKELGTIEAMNFYELVKIKSTNILKAICPGGTLQSGELFWSVLENEGNSNERPWGSGSLFTYDAKTDGVWLDKYVSKNEEFIYPAQNIDFSTLDSTKKQVDDGIYPNENDDVILSKVSNARVFTQTYIKSQKINAFFNLMIEEDMSRLNDAIALAASSSEDEAYSTICKDFIIKATEYKADNIAKIFAQNKNDRKTSFISKLPEEIVKQNYLLKEQYNNHFVLSNDSVVSYVNSRSNSSPTNFMWLSEVFGCKVDNGKYEIDTSKSFFTNTDVPNTDNFGSEIKPYANAILFLMGINGINYGNVKALFGKNSFITLPKVVALQIGAVLSVMVYNNSPSIKTWDINENVDENYFEQLKKIIPIPRDFHILSDTINKMNALGKIYLLKYFINWAIKNSPDIANLDKTPGLIKTQWDNNNIVILKQGNGLVGKVTNDLLSMVTIIRGNANSFKKEDGGSLTRKDCFVSKSDMIDYLNAFITKLKELSNLDDGNGGITQIAKTSDKTTDDMKMEVYRYLKQIYDRWIPTTDMDDWKVESFFSGMNSSSRAGHHFHFIDSYYNKINTKLLINPRDVSERVAASLQSTDINVTMQSFLADVYAKHRCMFKCIQNFANLGNEQKMRNMFKPIPYSEMEGPKVHPDFVVVYTYEPSKNLNIDNGEFKDDGFMLNDEMETPVAIRSRRTDNKDGYYLIPAFGVSYGKQYQNYFKNVSVNMNNAIQTQQALIAKHAILQASRSEKSKSVAAQDFYDIYSTQSFTCNVEMMGCAWVQPMMYFVLLNIPMFRGSYMIMKVNHKITPGNMVTTFTGCRMANVGNRFIQDIFSDEDTNDFTGDMSTSAREKAADVNNDCPYKVYPLIENYDDYTLTKDELANAKQIMSMLKANGASDMVAAGIVGNMYKESGLDPTKQNQDPNSTASGLIQWLGANLGCMLNNEYKEYWFEDKYKITTAEKAEVKRRLQTDRGAAFQCKFVIDSMRENNHASFKNLWTSLHQKTTPEAVADEFCKKYEVPTSKDKINSYDTSGRQKAARKFYDNRNASEPPKKDSSTNPELTNDNLPILLFNAVQKSLSSTNSNSTLNFAHGGGNDKTPTKPLTITSSNGNNLAKVFDIILNTPQYFENVKTLYWCYPSNGNGVQTEEPAAVAVETQLKAKPEDQRVFVVPMSNGVPSTTSRNVKFTKPEDANSNILMALTKKYGNNLSSNVKFMPQFTEGAFKDIKIADCDSVVGSSEFDNTSGIKNYVNGKIGDWDVGTSVNYLLTYAKEHTKKGTDSGVCKQGAPFSPTSVNPDDRRNTCETGVCYGYVKRALQAGGINLNGKSAYMAASQMPGKGFIKVKEGRGDTVDYSNKQLGDITIFDKCSGHEHGHITMWCGNQWISDFKQMSNRIKNGVVTNYTVWRYSGKGKS